MSDLIRRGDKVRYVDGYGMTAYGEVTQIREYDGKVKVLFDGAYDLDYDYYPRRDLEVITEDEYNANKS